MRSRGSLWYLFDALREQRKLKKRQIYLFIVCMYLVFSTKRSICIGGTRKAKGLAPLFTFFERIFNVEAIYIFKLIVVANRCTNVTVRKLSILRKKVYFMFLHSTALTLCAFKFLLKWVHICGGYQRAICE